MDSTKPPVRRLAIAFGLCAALVTGAGCASRSLAVEHPRSSAASRDATAAQVARVNHALETEHHLPGEIAAPSQESVHGGHHGH